MGECRPKLDLEKAKELAKELDAREEALQDSLKWTPRPPTVDPPIPVTIQKLKPATHHLLGDMVFFHWYRDEMDRIYEERCPGKILETEIQGFDFDSEMPNAEYRQQIPNGEVVGSIDQMIDAAGRASTGVKNFVHHCLLQTEGGREDCLALRIKSPQRTCDKADRNYSSRSPGPALSWVHDVVGARIWLQSEEKIHALFTAMSKFASGASDKHQIIRVRNGFKHPHPSNYREITVFLRSKFHPNKASSGWFVAELQLTLAAFHEFNTKMHCHSIYLRTRDFFHDQLSSEKAKLALLERIYEDYCTVAKKDRLDADISAMIDRVRADEEYADFLAGAAALLESVGDFDAAVPLRDRHAALTLRRQANRDKLPPAENSESSSSREKTTRLARVLFAYGKSLLETKRYFKAARILRQASEIHAKEGGNKFEHAEIGERYGLALICAKRLKDAYDVLDDAKESSLRRNAKVGQILHNLGYVASATGDRKKAEELYLEAAKIRQDACGSLSFCYGTTLFNLANTLAANKSYVEAAAKYEEALVILAKVVKKNSKILEKQAYEACSINFAKVLLDIQYNVEKARAVLDNAGLSVHFSRSTIQDLQENVLASNDEFEIALRGATAAPDVLSFRATDRYDAIAGTTTPVGATTTSASSSSNSGGSKDPAAAAANSDKPVETPVPQKKKKKQAKESPTPTKKKPQEERSSIEDRRGSMQCRRASMQCRSSMTDTISLRSQLRARLASVSDSSTPMSLELADEHRTTRALKLNTVSPMFLVSDEDDQTGFGYQTAWNFDTTLYKSGEQQLGNGEEQAKLLSETAKGVLEAQSPGTSQKATPGRSGSFLGHRKSAQLQWNQQETPFEYIEGGVSGAQALSGPSFDDVDNTIDAFPHGSFVMYDGAYRGIVEEILGSGQFGTVHKFCDVITGTKVAMKSIAASLRYSEGDGVLPDAAIERLERMICEEAGICFAIGTHANLVSMRRVFAPLPGIISNFSHVLVFSDLVDGKTLSSWMGVMNLKENNGHVVTNRVFQGPLYSGDSGAGIRARLSALTAQLYLGVHHMHQRAVMHQDIKPDNCMVTAKFWLRLTDYGLAAHARKRSLKQAGHNLSFISGKDDAEAKLEEQVEPTITANLKGGSPAYMSPEALAIMESARYSSTNWTQKKDSSGGRPQHRRRSLRMLKIHRNDERQVTPAESDLWSAAVVVLELYARRSFKRRAMTAADEMTRFLQADDPRYWSPTEVSEWARDNGIGAADCLRRRKVSGTDLGTMTERKLETLLASENGEKKNRSSIGERIIRSSIGERSSTDDSTKKRRGSLESPFGGQVVRMTDDDLRKLLSLRSTLRWQPMPPAVAAVVQKSVDPKVEDRWRTSSGILSALGCDVLYGELRSCRNMVGYETIPDEAKRLATPHDEDDVRGTLGNIGKLFQAHGRWLLALGSYAEWIGASTGRLRDEGVQHYCAALEKAEPGTVRYVDFSRQVKEHWRALETGDFERIFGHAGASVHQTHIHVVDLHRQHHLDGDLRPLSPLRRLRVLSLAYCSRLIGTLDPLAGMQQLEHLDLTACDKLEGPLDCLIHCVQMKRIILDDCAKLATTLDPLAKFKNLQLFHCNTMNKMQLTGTLEPLAQLTKLADLQLQECRRLKGTLETSDKHPGIFAQLTNLVRLDISRTEFAGDVKVFEHMLKLQDLRLAECHDMTGSLTSFSALEELETLDLQGCSNITGSLDALEDCAKLTTLNLRCCDKIDGGLDPVANLLTLELLNLDECKNIKGSIDAVHRLGELTALDLSGTAVTIGDSDSLAAMRSLQSLQRLRLELCHNLTGSLDGLDGCVELKSLKIKCLGGTQSSKQDFHGTLDPLTGCMKLEKLCIQHCKRLQGTLEPLGNLVNLIELDLEGCQRLSGTLDPLATCASLMVVNLSHCQNIRGSIQPLATIPHLEICDLNLVNCKSLNDLTDFVHYQNNYPNNSVHQYFQDKDKVSDAQAARSRKFLGY